MQPQLSACLDTGFLSLTGNDHGEAHKDVRDFKLQWLQGTKPFRSCIALGRVDGMAARTMKARGIMDIRLPSDFPRNPDLSFFRRVETRAQQDGYPDDWQGHFIGSWKAVAYRFKACDQHSRSFTRSIEKWAARHWKHINIARTLTYLASS